MTAEIWAEVRSALEQALSFSAADRAAFLDGLGRHNPAVRREVEELLAAEMHATQLFSVDRWRHSASQLLSGGEPGMLVGRYRLVRELGRGGMGTVYLAERADGEYSHQVAVKLLQPGIVSPAMTERFRQERQILARLSHPGIARLLDGGVTDGGILYAVMEYVEGEPIDAYCDREGLDVEARLRLFLRAAEAVQYAHQQMVLHLDIKPANLLVTPDGEPRLLDFGISRIIAGTENSAAQSAATTRLLTPVYASPEQASGEPLSVASDVYSLGTLLFRLLTGTLPYPVENLGPLEAARVIREVAPQRASRVAPQLIRSQFRGDLDLILLKALRKEPERRYPTAAAFAEDIERFLTSRPVTAHGDSLGYRATRFVRRNRAALMVSALVLLVIVGAIGAVVRAAVVARRQEALANRRLGEVRQLAHSYIFDLDPQLQGIPGTVAVRNFILQTGMKYLDAIAAEAGTDDALNDELARGYMRLSILENSFIYQSMGNKQQAQKAMDKAVDLVTAAYRRDPKNLNVIERYLLIVGNASMELEAQGDIEGYDAMMQKLWSVGQPLLTAEGHRQGLFEMGTFAGEMATDRIGNGALWNLADPEGGLEWERRSKEIMDRVQRENPSDTLAKRAMVDNIYGLATDIDGFAEMGDAAGVSRTVAEMQRLSSQPSFQQDPTLAPARRVASDYILSTYVMLHRLADAEAVAPRIKITEMPEKGNNSRLRIATAGSLCMRGLLDLELGRSRVGTAEMQRGLEIYEDVLRADPSDTNSTVQIVFYGTRLGQEPLAPAPVRREALQRVIQLSENYAHTRSRVASAQARLAAAWLSLESIDREEAAYAPAAEDDARVRAALKRLRELAPHDPQVDFFESEREALASGKLDHASACRQRIGGLYFNVFLRGPQQIEACAARSNAEIATPARAKAGLKPSPVAP